MLRRLLLLFLLHRVRDGLAVCRPCCGGFHLHWRRQSRRGSLWCLGAPLLGNGSINERANELLQLLRGDQLRPQVLLVCLDHLPHCCLLTKLSEATQWHDALAQVVGLLSDRINQHDCWRAALSPDAHGNYGLELHCRRVQERRRSTSWECSSASGRCCGGFSTARPTARSTRSKVDPPGRYMFSCTGGA